MENDEWQEFVEALVDAKRSLAEATCLMDGIDGFAEGAEASLSAALAAIDSVYAIERDHDFNQDVASPAHVERFWAQHGRLPGFALGT